MNSISIGFSDEFRPFANGVAQDAVDPVDFWYPIAQLARKHFPNRQEFMHWVNVRYQGDQNRMAAGGCWDLIRLEEAE